MQLIFQLGTVQPKGLNINFSFIWIGTYIHPFWYFFTEYHLISYWSTSVTIPDGFPVKHSFVIKNFVVCLQINCLVTLRPKHFQFGTPCFFEQFTGTHWLWTGTHDFLQDESQDTQNHSRLSLIINSNIQKKWLRVTWDQAVPYWR